MPNETSVRFHDDLALVVGRKELELIIAKTRISELEAERDRLVAELARTVAAQPLPQV